MDDVPIVDVLQPAEDVFQVAPSKSRVGLPLLAYDRSCELPAGAKLLDDENLVQVLGVWTHRAG